ncbi:opacity-associated protein OapA [Rodentibacter heidelbergensis]|uniref:Acetylglucosamine transferase n=1 Tax=Rodentibacter heidelbergensis TaxID=1908258 RepID=A0A1V3IBM2_9PAST|nr:opacity-associated protein OapA [Rodentibacter heidelbergensis]OOF37145.1 acetylglucosamine transferase [Rodentibacter heidelbergensis]
MNNNQSNDNQSQNELDLGLNQADSITPRKPIQSSESFFDKAKGLFGRKDQPETQFHVRKEPTFGESSTQETAQSSHLAFTTELKTTAENVTQTTIEKVEDQVEELKESVVSTTEQAKETLAGGAAAVATALKRPEKWKILQILPEKHRRLFIAILALVLLLILFFALKPNSDTVESFELQNSNEIPVQFQSLDQSQPIETTVLDNIPAPQETAPVAEPQANASAEPGKMEYMGDAQKDAPKQQESVVAAPSVQPETLPIAPVSPQPAKQIEARRETVSRETAKPFVQAPKVVEKTVVKPQVQTKPAQAKSEQVRQAPVKEVKPVEKKAIEKNERKVQIVEAKPATNAVKTTASGSASKTLTVPKGVSLMQVFRDNNLNISDVNAMTKANGAGNALSSFKPGDKVQVSLNGQGRVNELRLSNGAKFVRQSDGSYQFQK